MRKWQQAFRILFGRQHGCKRRRRIDVALAGILLAATAAVAAADSDSDFLRKEAWVSGQMQAIEKDPRVYLEYQQALADEVFRRRPGLVQEVYKPRLGDAVREIGKRTWDFAKSEEVDLALSGAGLLGTAGDPGKSIGRVVGVLKGLREFGIKVENIQDKWQREDARRFVSLVREDLEVVLRDVYARSRDLAKRSERASYRPDLLKATDQIAKDFSVVPPYASDRQIFNSASQGDFGVKIYQVLSRKSDEELRRLLGDQQALKAFLRKELGDQRQIAKELGEQMTGMQESLAVLVAARKAAAAEAEVKRKQEAFDLKYQTASDYTHAVTGVLRFIDPRAAETIEKGAGAVLIMSRSIDSLAQDGFSAAATGNLLGGAYAFYSLMSGPAEDPTMKAIMAQFQAISEKLSRISEQLRNIDSKIDAFIQMQNSGFSEVQQLLKNISDELRMLQTYVDDVEVARAQGAAKSEYILCADRLARGAFSVDDRNSLDLYHQCLWKMYSLGVVEASKPEAISSTVVNIGLRKRAGVGHLSAKLRSSGDLENIASALDFFEEYAAKNLDVKTTTPKLRIFSTPFNKYAVDGAETFSPKLWAAAVRGIIDYRIGFSEYSPPTAAPSARYLLDLAEMGEWQADRLATFTRSEVAFRALRVYRDRAMEVAKLTDKIVRQDLKQRYPEAFHAKRLGPSLRDYLDLPVSVFLGFESDSEWRSKGFSTSSLRDLVSLAGALGLIEVESSLIQTVGDRQASGGARKCYRSDAKIRLKSEPTLEIGHASITGCGTLTEGGLNGIFQAGNIEKSTKEMADYYAIFGYFSPHFNRKRIPIPEAGWDALTINFEAKTLQRGIIGLSLDSESYQESARDKVKTQVIGAVRRDALAALDKHFSSIPTGPVSNRDIAISEIFEPLNEAYAGLLIALTARHGSCGRTNPYLARIMGRAVSEFELEDYIEGKNLVFSLSFWRRLSLTTESDGLTRLLPAKRNENPSDVTLLKVVDTLSTLPTSADVASIDLYRKALAEFAQPEDPKLYRYCAEVGMPSLVTGMKALNGWNNIIEYQLNKPTPISQSPNKSVIYRCTKGKEVLLQNSACPKGYTLQLVSTSQ